MEENFSLRNCDGDDVLSFKDDVFKADKVKKAMQLVFQNPVAVSLSNWLSHQGVKVNLENNSKAKWFDEGVDCEILKPDAKGWRRGKFRMRIFLEFCPDESEIAQPESPLDDIRQTITESIE